MKKFISMLVVICTLALVSVSAFAAETEVIGSSISEKLDESGKYWIIEETFEDGSKVIRTESCFEELLPEEILEVCPECGEIHDGECETLISDDLLEVCPKCGKIHDGCCEEEAKRIYFKHYIDSDQEYLKFCDIKQNAMYFVTADNKLMLMNLKTKQLYFVADEVAGLARFGMNGRYIAYVTLQDKFISVPYEIGADGKLSIDFQKEFGD